MGDGLLFTFPTVSEAVKCGIKIQEQTKGSDDLNLRIGIHEGEITLKDGDVLGDDVNVASRIEPFSAVGGIAISGKVQQNISSLTEFETKYIGKPKLKGVSQEVKVYCITSHELPQTDLSKVSAKLEKNNPIKFTFWWTILLLVSALLVIFFLMDNYFPSSDNISNNFLIHINTDSQIIEGISGDSYKDIDINTLQKLREKIIPMINSKIAGVDIYTYYPDNKMEYELMNKFPIYDKFLDSRTPIDGDTSLVVIKNYKNKITNINNAFEYFTDKYNVHIDLYISMFISYRVSDSSLYISNTNYIDGNGNDIYTEFTNVGEDIESINQLPEEITSRISYILEEYRYGGSRVGFVEEVLDTNLLSIKIENSRIVENMLLFGQRTYIYQLGQKTFDQYLSDRQNIINYYKNNPDELNFLRQDKDWMSYHWYPQAKNIDELLILFQEEIDSMIINKISIINEWESRINEVWDGINIYQIKIIKIIEDKAIAKIILRDEGYVTPAKGDYIHLWDD